MWDKWQEAGQGAVERWREVLDTEIMPKQTAPQEAVVQRYVREHRGKWQAVKQFAAQHVAPARVEAEARRYVQEMERRLAGG